MSTFFRERVRTWEVLSNISKMWVYCKFSSYFFLHFRTQKRKWRTTTFFVTSYSRFIMPTPSKKAACFLSSVFVIYRCPIPKATFHFALWNHRVKMEAALCWWKLEKNNFTAFETALFQSETEHIVLTMRNFPFFIKFFFFSGKCISFFSLEP